MSYFPNSGPTTAAQSQSITPAVDSAQFPTGNIQKIVWDNFSSYTPNLKYTQTVGSGDIVQLDGNSASASYMVISKSPWNAGTETILDSIETVKLPAELSIGVHRSIPSFNQEFCIEFVDTDTPAAAPADIEVSGLIQSTTTLTVNTATPHGLTAGTAIGIRGCPDSRFNYGSVVINTVTSATQFTVTAGPAGNMPSLSVTATVPAATVYVYVRRRLGGSANGISMIFENASATNASFYIRSETGDTLPSGTITGNHSLTVGSTASNALVSSYANYAFHPSTEYRLFAAFDRCQLADSGVDSISGISSRILRTGLLLNPDKNYKLRIRAVNTKAMSVPVAKIISATKTVAGGTTATVVLDRTNHGLTTSDTIYVFGVRDTSNFPNVTTPATVTNVTGNTITVVIGTAPGSTVISYGGYVARANGGNAAHNIQGALAPVGNTVSVASGAVTLVGSATFASVLAIGDSVELIGVRESTSGNDLLVDGAYKVRTISTTTLELEPLPGTTLPSSFSTTNAGGGIIRRTDIRISFIKLVEFLRERVEFAPRTSTDGAAALPVNIVAAPSLTVGSASLAPSASLGAGTFHRLLSANTTNLTSVKTSAGTINSLNVSNTNAPTTYFLKIYNKASAPVLASDTPVHTIALPPGTYPIDTGTYGIRLSTGIAYAITGAVADTDTTVIPATAVLINMSYT